MLNLINGDCLIEMDSILDGSIDMILTDPPYGMNYISNHRQEKYNSIKNDDGLEWLPKFIEQIYRVSKNNTAHYLFSSFHKIDIFKQVIEKRFTLKNILVWEKNNTSMGDLNGDFAPKIEFILFFQKGRCEIIGSRDANIIKDTKTGNNFHPTEKPVSLMTYLMMKFSKDNTLILDPFMGSGSTGVACRNLNRSFIGIEQDKKYFEIARERISNTNRLFSKGA